MNRIHQILFVVSVLALSWYGMMAVHELGHVLGATLTGGTIEQVILHPLTISRTDVSPNPQPGIVVWLGPVAGATLPLLLVALIPKQLAHARRFAWFFAGFCLIANGAYIAIGSFDQIGDCKEMLRTGTPFWGLIVFGCVTIPIGFFLWHRLGSLKDFFSQPENISLPVTCICVAALVIVVATGFALSPY